MRARLRVSSVPRRGARSSRTGSGLRSRVRGCHFGSERRHRRVRARTRQSAVRAHAGSAVDGFDASKWGRNGGCSSGGPGEQKEAVAFWDKDEDLVDDTACACAGDIHGDVPDDCGAPTVVPRRRRRRCTKMWMRSGSRRGVTARPSLGSTSRSTGGCSTARRGSWRSPPPNVGT